MKISNLLAVGKNISAALATSKIIEQRPERGELLLKEWIISILIKQQLKAHGVKDINQVFINNNGLCIDHDIFGIICLNPRSITFTPTESVLEFDTRLLVDKKLNELQESLLIGTVTAAAGGLLQVLSFGFIGSGVQRAGEMEIATAAIKHYKAPQFEYLGPGQLISMPSITILDPGAKLKEIMAINNDKLLIDLSTENKAIVISSKSISQEQMPLISKGITEAFIGFLPA